MDVERIRKDVLRAPLAYHSPKRGRGTFESPQSRYPGENRRKSDERRGQ
jgi:hypothetical protein